MGRGGDDRLSRPAFILHEHVEQIAEMPGKFSGPHGGPQLQRALKRHDFNFQPPRGEQALIRGNVQDHGIRSGQ